MELESDKCSVSLRDNVVVVGPIYVINFGETVSYGTFEFINNIGFLKTSSFRGGVVAGDKMCCGKFFFL